MYVGTLCCISFHSCILVVRGSLINMGFYLQAKVSVMGAKLAAPNTLRAAAALLSTLWHRYPEAVALTSFFAVFGVVIALMKDVPDVRGDVEYKIPSFSVKLGAAKMFRYPIFLDLFSLLPLGKGCKERFHPGTLVKDIVYIIYNFYYVCSVT